MATFYNQATLSFNGTLTNSNVITGELVEVLSAEKRAINDSYIGTDNITYVISIVNSGTRDLNGIYVKDNLGEYKHKGTSVFPLTYVEGTLHYYVNGELQETPDVTAGPPLVIRNLNIPADGNALLIYIAEPNEFASPKTKAKIRNVAKISGSDLCRDIEVYDTIGSADIAQLNISKSISPTTVIENGRLTYTFVIQNTGNTPATKEDDVIVTDTFNPRLRNLTVTLNGTVLTEGNQYTYDKKKGEFETVAGVITVPAATYDREYDGGWSIDPGVAVLQVTGTVWAKKGREFSEELSEEQNEESNEKLNEKTNEE